MGREGQLLQVGWEVDGISGGGTGGNRCQWVGENSGFGNSKTLELRLKGLRVYKQEGNRSWLSLDGEIQIRGRVGGGSGSLLMRNERICKADENTA